MKDKFKRIFSQFFSDGMKSIELDSESRKKNKETEKYRQKWILVASAIFVALCGFEIRNLLTPAPDVAEFIEASREKYFEVREGSIRFSDEMPSEGVPAAIQFKLPFRDLKTVAGYDPRKIWYRFQIQIPDAFYKAESTGIYIPPMWGRYRIYFDGREVDFGANAPSALPAPAKNFRVDIKVDGNPAEFNRVGIRATFPLVVGDIVELRKFDDLMANQYPAVVPRALMAQVVMVFLFILLFAFVPRKPELLLFSLFFLLNAVYGKLYTMKFELNSTFAHREDLYDLMLTALAFAKGLCLLVFTFEFFRMSRAKISEQVKAHLVLAAILIPSVFYALLRLGTSSDYFLKWNTVQELFFLVAAVVASAQQTAYIFLNLKMKQRAFLGALMTAAISYTFARNFHDYFFQYNKLTTEYINNIYTYFIVALVTILEFARTERERMRLVKILPKEERDRLLLKQDSRKQHSGFVALVDMVGFHRMLKSIKIEDHPKFMSGIMRHLMKHFHRGSKLASTGDGFYFSWEAEYSDERLLKCLKVLGDLQNAELCLQDLGIDYIENQKIQFRVVLGYGDYTIGLAEEGEFASDFTVSILMNELSRILSAGMTSVPVKILSEKNAKAFAEKFGLPQESIAAKNDERYEAIPFSEGLLAGFSKVRIFKSTEAA